MTSPLSLPRLLLAAIALALVSVAVARGGGTRPERHDVAMRAFAFAPTLLEARAGDTIVWTNHDVVPHTATSDDGSIDSGMIAPGASWTFVVPEVEHLTYVCIFHPTMTGTISVR